MTPAADFAAVVASCVGPDDPTWRAVQVLAPAWESAMAFSYELGERNGYARGYRACEIDQAADWSAAAALVCKTLRSSTRDELEASRKVDHLPCATRCGACSRCIHALAWLERGGRPFGGSDNGGST